MKTLILIAFLLSSATWSKEDCPLSHSKNLEDFLEGAQALSQGGCSNFKGIKGKSVEEVLEKCVHSGSTEKECAKSIRCQGFEKICEARFAPYRYPGSNPHQAVKLCMLAGRGEAECASATVCFRAPDIGMCEVEFDSNRYPGFTVKESLELCARSGRDIMECASTVSCSGFKKLCFARLGDDEYPGLTREEALEVCTLAGRNHDMCARSVVCN